MDKINFRIPMLVALGLYLFSLTLPVYTTSTLPGWMALALGWVVGLNDIPTAISWFANVTFIYSIILILKRKKPKPLRTLIMSFLSIIIGLIVLGAGRGFSSEGASQVVGNFSMGMGFYVDAQLCFYGFSSVA